MLINAPTSVTEQEPEVESANIAALFDQLLTTERTSPEFLTLWQKLDEYLNSAVAEERAVEL